MTGIVKFLSTLSLRRATSPSPECIIRDAYFYPRSPCGERQSYIVICSSHLSISIHALLAESDPLADGTEPDATISIHALLAESDACYICAYTAHTHFYPRSPCGERQIVLACRLQDLHISIHALLAESDPFCGCMHLATYSFLSTLSLRRATYASWVNLKFINIFLSTLSLRRATFKFIPCSTNDSYFYPRSPCGERRYSATTSKETQQSEFLSTLSLRRATFRMPVPA